MGIQELFVLGAKLSTVLAGIYSVIILFIIKRSSGFYRILGIYLVLGFLIDLLSRYFGFVSPIKNNLFMFPVETLVELVLITWLYIRYMLPNRRYHFVIYFLVLLGFIPLTYDFIHSLNPENMNGLMFYGSFYVNGLLVLICILYYLQTAFNKKMEINGKKLIVNTLMFLSFVIGLLYMLSINFLLNENVKIVTYFWILRMIVIIGVNSIILYLIWKDGKIPKRLQ
jgi:hypothetical protein